MQEELEVVEKIRTHANWQGEGAEAGAICARLLDEALGMLLEPCGRAICKVFKL